MKISEVFPIFNQENVTYELKRELNKNEWKKWLKTVCAFSNTIGGHLIIGVSDDEEIIGMSKKIADDTCVYFSQMVRQHTSPIVRYKSDVKEPVRNGGRYIIDFEVKKNDTMPSWLIETNFEPLLFIRREGETTAPTIEEMISMLNRVNIYDYDKTAIGIRRDDVSFHQLEDELKTSSNNLSVSDKFLQSYNLITRDGFLTINGFLFCDNTEYKNANAIATTWPDKDKGSSKFINTRNINGSLIHIMHELIKYMSNVEYYQFGGVKKQIQREDIGSFAIDVVKEAIVNALVHRDYKINGNNISLDCFKDRLEIFSPGSSLHVDNDKVTQKLSALSSFRRNESICRVFEACHLMENRGSGFSKIIKDYENLGETYAPLYKSNSISFTIILKNKKSVQGDNVTTAITTSGNYLLSRPMFTRKSEIFRNNENYEIITNHLTNNNGKMSYDDIARLLSMTKDGAKYYIKRMKEACLIRRVGSNISGRYENVSDDDRPASFVDLDPDEKNLATLWCSKHFEQSNEFNQQQSSNILKSLIEENTSLYLSNGQFKGAMLLAGFKVEDIESLNWSFNVSEESSIFKGDIGK